MGRQLAVPFTPPNIQSAPHTRWPHWLRSGRPVRRITIQMVTAQTVQRDLPIRRPLVNRLFSQRLLMPQAPYHAPFVQIGVTAVRVPKGQPVDTGCVAVQSPLLVRLRWHPSRQNVGVNLTAGAACGPDQGGNINIHIPMPGVGNDEFYRPLLGPGSHIEAIPEIVQRSIHNKRLNLDMPSLPQC